jgi:hypothetical protein
MEPVSETYSGHRIEVRIRSRERAAESDAPEGGAGEEELLINDQPVPHGQLPDGQYFLRENAYEWGDDLASLAERLIDYRRRTGEARRQRIQEGGE